MLALLKCPKGWGAVVDPAPFVSDAPERRYFHDLRCTRWWWWWWWWWQLQ